MAFKMKGSAFKLGGVQGTRGHASALKQHASALKQLETSPLKHAEDQRHWHGPRYLPTSYGGKNPLEEFKQWKKDNYKETWQKGETLNVGIGQGFLLSTPLELAIMTGNIINKGNIINPNIVKSTSDVNIKNNNVIQRSNFKVEHLNIIKNAMYKVINSPKGTAWKSRVIDKDFQIAGKTGTSQVRIISPKERELGIVKNKDLPYEKRDHALFIGFAPFNDPKYITTVILEHAGGGASYAAPIGRELLVATRKVIEGIDTDISVS